MRNHPLRNGGARIRLVRGVPASVRVLSMLLCIYLAAPLFDLPLLGISLSAPLILLLAIEVQLKLKGLHIWRLNPVPMLLGAIWVGQVASLGYAEFFGDNLPDLTVGVQTLLRYAYWFFVCALSARLFLEEDLPDKAVRYFSHGCLIVAIVVISEFMLFGGLTTSGWSAFTSMSQNGYGWQFSAFTPFVVFRALSAPINVRPWAVLSLVVVLLAVYINGSRSSWGTVALGLALCLAMVAAASRKIRVLRYAVILGALLSIGAAALAWLPEEMALHAQSRILSGEELQRDKSWQIRLLMIQKAVTLFQSEPVFGVGPGQFRIAVADLVIPANLGYESNEYFNRKSSHNSYMQLLAEGGLVLAIPMALFLLWLLKAGGQAALQLSRSGSTWAIPIWVSFICLSVHFWTIAGFTSTGPWFLYGLVASLVLRSKAKPMAQGLSMKR